MSLSYNRVVLAGNLTRDPETRTMGNEGKIVANFGMALNHTYKDKSGEKKEDVTFVDIEAWGRTAELIGQYLAKGSQCLIEGRLKLDSWDDKSSGQKRSKLKVVADSVQFIGGKKDGAEAPAAHRPAQVGPTVPSPAAAGALDDEPPF